MFPEVRGPKNWLGNIRDPELMERRMTWSKRDLEATLAKGRDLGVIGCNEAGRPRKRAVERGCRINAFISTRIDEEKAFGNPVEDGDG